jgi:hypothetical protein
MISYKQNNYTAFLRCGFSDELVNESIGKMFYHIEGKEDMSLWSASQYDFPGDLHCRKILSTVDIEMSSWLKAVSQM